MCASYCTWRENVPKAFHFESEGLFIAQKREATSLLSSRSCMKWCWRIPVFLLTLCCGASVFAQSGSKQSSDSLIFVRQFSSAQDVKRTHPIVDKALEIVAGPKDEVQVTDVLHNPNAVASDGEIVFVLDGGSPVVHVFDFARGKYSLLRDDRMQSPAGITADQVGNLYVSDGNSRSILVFDVKGKFSRELMKVHGRESYFEGPRGIAIHQASGHLYVCDAPRNMVIILNNRGKVLGRVGKRGGGPGQGDFRNPVKVAVTKDEVIVLDSGNFRLQVFDLQGRFQREMSLPDINAHSGLAADEFDNIYVADWNTGQIAVFAADGRPFYRFGQMGQGPGEFNGPTGLWIKSGCLYVADTDNRRVQEFRIDAGKCP